MKAVVRRHVRGRVLVVTVVGCSLLAVPASGAAVALVAPRTAAVALLSASDPAEPTEADLEAQRELLERLRAEVDAQTDDLKRAKAELRAASLEATAALEQYRIAVRQLQEARVAEDKERERLLAAQLDLVKYRRELGRWARQAYQGGGGLLEEHPAVVTVLQARTTDEISSTMATLRSVGRSKGRVKDAFERAEAAQAHATAAASAASAEAEAAQIRASRTKKESDAAVDRQRAVVRRQETIVARTRDEADEAAAEEKRLRKAAAEREARRRAARANGVVGEVGDCTGGDVGAYANGQIPLSALCPLWAAPEHRLRADAAHAFDRLSKAYAAHFGSLPCITDSYRTYAEQVDLYQRKPNLAATPGTSNHGWGTALDMCGGVQSFGTSTHEWMATNGPLYGWFHPAWAQQGGSRPEPWHFEYAG